VPVSAILGRASVKSDALSLDRKRVFAAETAFLGVGGLEIPAGNGTLSL